MFAGLDLARPHVFYTRLHALRGALPAGVRPGANARVVDRVLSTLGASIDKKRSVVLERWRSDEPEALRAVFESKVRVHRACALVSASTFEYDDGGCVSFAPWEDDALQCLIVPLPYRTTGMLTLRCEAAPFEGSRGPAFRLQLRCDKWSHVVTVRRT